MVPLHVMTLDGHDAALPQQDVERLSRRMHGPVLRPRDRGYNDARQVYNGMIDKHPAIIARCSNLDDVVAAVNFARDHELLVAIRGGGHNGPGLALCDGGLVIDLSAMKGVEVDHAARTATAQGGAT